MTGGMVDEGVDYAILAMGCDSTHKRYFRIAAMEQFDHRHLPVISAEADLRSSDPAIHQSKLNQLLCASLFGTPKFQ